MLPKAHRSSLKAALRCAFTETLRPAGVWFRHWVWVAFAVFGMHATTVFGAETGRIPWLGCLWDADTEELNRTNCVKSSRPGARVERHGQSSCVHARRHRRILSVPPRQSGLDGSDPNLLDAVIALTNQTFIRASFRPPFLLLHTDEDPLEPANTIEDEKTGSRLRGSVARCRT